MKKSTLTGSFCRVAVVATILPALLRGQNPSPIIVRSVQGSAHYFLSLRSEKGNILGYVEAAQSVHGDHVHSRFTYHFKDGSIDDDTADYTQRSSYRFIRDHHVQRGPFFSKSSDVLIEENGNVTTRTVEKSGKEKVETVHIDLPPDIVNGLIGSVLLNLSPKSDPVKVSFVAPVGKGRLIRLLVSVDAQQVFSPVNGVQRKATVFRIHPELGGVVGVIAPVVGKEPKDIFAWILESEAPGLIRQITTLEEGGPVVSIGAAGAHFPPVSKLK